MSESTVTLIVLIVVGAVALGAVGLVIAAGVRRRLERATRHAADESRRDEQGPKGDRGTIEHGPRAVNE